MDLQATYNEFGSPEKFYRFQTSSSGTTYDSHFGFLAGDCYGDYFPGLDYDEQRSIVTYHSIWSIKKASPFISTTSDLGMGTQGSKEHWMPLHRSYIYRRDITGVVLSVAPYATTTGLN